MNMPKVRKVKLLLDDLLPLDAKLPMAAEAKFSLYKKQRELLQLDKILENLSSGSEEDKVWLQNNNDLVFDLAEDFVDNSLAEMEGSTLDGETMQLSLKVMSGLRDTVSKFESIISNGEELEA